MALQRSQPHLGSIKDQEIEPKPDPDRVYEREIEKRIEGK
jgi:hypothetical protein